MLTLSTKESHRPLRPRDVIDRRKQGDRRRSPVSMRLRVGLWYQYHRATRAGEFDAFPRDHKRQKVEEALLPEMQKYQFSQRENLAPVPPSGALGVALDFLWAHPEIGCNATGESMAVYALNAISDFLVRTFIVEVTDRRKSERRVPQPQNS